MSGFSGYDESTVIDTAQGDPTAAVIRATALIEDPSTSERQRILALWARGIARRELADMAEAELDLVSAERLAAGIDPVLRGRVALTLALVVMYRGESSRALALLDQCEGVLVGEERGRMLLQRGLVEHRSGDLVSARSDYDDALTVLAEDDVSVIRLFLNLAVLDVYEGRPVDAIGRLVEARNRADAAGQSVLAASAVHNLGFAHAEIGDVVGALEHYDEAERRYGEAGVSDGRRAVLTSDRASTLLGANLLDAARVDSSEAMEILMRADLQVEVAETALLAARIRLALRDHAGASDAAAVARESFAATGRSAWVPLIRMLEVRIGAEEGRPPEDTATDAEAAATDLRRLRWHREADAGFLLAGRSFRDAGRPDDARRALMLVDDTRSRSSPIEKAALHLSRALIAEADGDRARARRSVSAGLTALWDGRLAVAHYELRAHAVSHAAELTRVGARLAIEDRRGREFIRRIEASRMISVAPPDVRPPRSDAIAHDLTALRTVTGRLRDVGHDAAELLVEQRRLERSIARAARRQKGLEPGGQVALARALTRLGPRTLLFLFELDGHIWAGVVSAGRASVHSCGPIRVTESAVTDQHFGISRLQRAGSSDASIQASRDVVERGGDEIAAMLPASVTRPDRPLVIVPSTATAAVCWAAIPALVSRTISVSGSLAAFSAAEQRRAERRSTTVMLVAGPDLRCADEEVEAIAARCGWRHVLRATSVDDVLARIEACDVAHLACHGRFRSDNPLFSSLRLDGGDLNFYDLESCDRLPHTIVMSACNAGLNAVLEGGALLGIASALIQLGVSSVIAPLTPVNDERSVDLMVRLHMHLAAGVEPAEALALASIGPDGALDPTAAPFICFGS